MNTSLRAAKNTHNEPILSVVVPTLNEEHYIGNLMNDIMRQDGYDEVIVADSGSKDGTQKIVEKFIKKYPGKSLKFIQNFRKGPSVARNTGANHAIGKYIIFLDADIRIPENFFVSALQEMTTRKLDMAGFFSITVSKNIWDRLFFFIQKYFLHKILQYTKYACLTGAGIMVRRDFHHNIGGFDENISLGEDLDYTKKSKAKGSFRMINSTYFIYSTRRFEKEGRFKLWLKCIKLGICHIFNIKESKIEYEFGHFTKNE